jgi:hypothetical protein
MINEVAKGGDDEFGGTTNAAKNVPREFEVTISMIHAEEITA